MRISITVALAAFLLTGTAFAQSNRRQTESAIRGTGRYGAAGCGLGSMAFGDTPGAVQILAATTNGLFGSQTFGITTGTSNCGPGLVAQGTKNYIEANREAFAKDVSRGQGESIGAISWINGCKDARAVGAALQRNFARIFPSERASDDDVTSALLQTLQADKTLGCAKG